ncbi:MAG: CusA/CzcA family heavy metal efflux RND transporter [Chitinophagaceae bacterium]
MLSAIIRFSVRNKLIIGIFTLAWIVWGLIELTKLPIDALPDITSNQVQVITATPTLASPEVERTITFPIEQSCFNIPHIREIRSISRFGLSVVTIVFDDDVDIYWARQQVSERILVLRDEIPAGSGLPEMAPMTTGLGEIYQYVLKPKQGYEHKYNLDQLRTIQDWIVRRQLLGTPGVADVSSFGGNLKQYEVAVRTEQLRGMGVSIADIFTALEKNNQNSGGSYIEKGPATLIIRTEGLATGIEDLGNIFVKTTASGIPVFVRDIADVRVGKAVRFGAMTYNQEGEVAGAVVLMLKGANASQVVSSVKTKIEKIRKTLPEGVELITFYDRTKIVDRAIGTVKKNLLEGALIVVLILVLFLGNLRASLIVASVIPLAMMFAIGMMNMFGVSGNLMSLGALDFGLIVDGAVIIVEAVMHRLYHRNLYNRIISQTEMDDAVVASSSRMMNAAAFGQAIILIVYLPILSLTGIEGKMFRPMAQTVAFALIGAFILSLTYVPMMTAMFLSKKVKEEENWTDKVMNKIKSGYASLLQNVFRFPKLVGGVAIALMIFAVFIATILGGEFIPKLEEGDFAIDARSITGTSLTQSVKSSLKASDILLQFPEVEKIVTRIGASEIPTDPMPVEMTDIIVTLKDKRNWTSADNYDDLANMMSDSLRKIPGFTTGFQYPIQMRFNELIAGARQDVVCKIFGENLDSLAVVAAKLGTVIHSINGATDVYVEAVTGLPQIVVRYKRDLLAMYRLSVDDVNRTVRTAFAGEAAGKIYENERRYDVVVRLHDQSREDVEDIRQLMVTTPSGVQIPLNQVADINLEVGPNQIQREDAKRRIIVGFNTRGRDVQSVVSELQTKVEKQLHMPAGYYIHYGGQFENLVEAKKRLSIAVPVALALIFIMLYFAFGSIKYGLMIYTAIPLSAIGGVLSLWMRGMPFSISAGVGFIALFGVAVLNGIVLITEFNRLKKEGMTDVKKIIMEGTSLRLRPVLMTAAVASFGFLPMALSQSAGAEVQRPLATVVIGGLITATMLTLLVLPLLYYWLERRKPVVPLALIFIPLLLLATNPSQAQSTGKLLSLDSMLSMGVRQNLQLEADRKASAYWQTLGERTFALPKTQLGAEYGNINSFNNDTRFFVNQGFYMPSVYRNQKELYNAQKISADANLTLREAEIRRGIRLAYYGMQDNQLRAELLYQLDTVYANLLKAAELRYRTGESPMIEKTAAETQVAMQALQKEQLGHDLELLQQRLSYLLRVTEKYLPAEKGINLTVGLDTAGTRNPLVAYWQSQQAVNAAEVNTQRAALAPELTLGYSNLSLIGWQSADGVTQKYYSGGDRFNIFSMVLGIPIFNGAVRQRMKAGEVNKEMSRLQMFAAEAQYKNQFAQLQEQYLKHMATVKFYEQKGLKQAELLISQADVSYRTGNISYVEWTALMKQAIDIKLSYLDALAVLKTTYAEWEYVKGN